jgi:hypothetical protein
MRGLKLVLAVIAVTLAFDNLDQDRPRIAVYWGLVAAYWFCNAFS